jgi:predicted O-linked N-acetylglucosamine transferase (SPINDLY family)
MFFPRLRNQAKWAFVFLIIVFAGGFIFLGVGSGGLDLGQLMRDAFGRGGSSGPSVSEAQKKVAERPFNAQARKDLATALENKGRTADAIAAWLEYGKLRPKDVVALRHLGDLELGQANTNFQDAQLAALQQSQAAAGNQFRPSSGKLGQALGNDPLTSAATTQASTTYQTAVTKYQTAANQAISTYQQIVKLQPKNQEALFALAQAADTLHQNPAAVSAYKRLLKLDLDASTKAQIRARIKTLQAGGQG